jgi:hypothetical protein
MDSISTVISEIIWAIVLLIPYFGLLYILLKKPAEYAERLFKWVTVDKKGWRRAPEEAPIHLVLIAGGITFTFLMSLGGFFEVTLLTARFIPPIIEGFLFSYLPWLIMAFAAYKGGTDIRSHFKTNRIRIPRHRKTPEEHRRDWENRKY